MSDFEVRANIKFMVKLGWIETEIREALGKAYVINSSKKTPVYKWVQRFPEGREKLEDDPRTRRPTKSKKSGKHSGCSKFN